LLRPDRSLILFRYRRETFVEESLDALTAISLGRVDVAFRIGRDAVHSVELARLTSAVAETRQDFERVAKHDVDLVVRTVDQIDLVLLRILREREVPNGSVAERSLRDEHFLDERAVFLENLNSIIHTVAYIQEPLDGEFGAMNGIPKLLGRR